MCPDSGQIICASGHVEKQRSIESSLSAIKEPSTHSETGVSPSQICSHGSPVHSPIEHAWLQPTQMCAPGVQSTVSSPRDGLQPTIARAAPASASASERRS